MRCCLQTLVVSLFAVAFACPAWGVPAKFTQQGRLLDSAGVPLEGIHAIIFTLYDAETSGAAVWTELQAPSCEQGYYAVTLGSFVTLDEQLFADGPLWLEIQVDGVVLAPRQEILSVPYALRAGSAEHLNGGLVDADEVSVDGTVVIDTAGNWVGPTPEVSWNNLSDVPTEISDGDQDSLGGLACAQGQLPKWDGSDWGCAPDSQLSEGEVDALVGNNGYLTAADLPPPIPSGMIGFFADTCPSGWTDLSTSFGGRALVLATDGGTLGESSKVGDALGDQGTRTITAVAAHAHTGPDHTNAGPSHTHGLSGASTSSDGSHSHSVNTAGAQWSIYNAHALTSGSGPGTTGASGDHSHSISGTTDPGGTGATGSGGTGTTGSAGDAAVDVTMPYIQLKACQAP